eukprot:scaffold10069_cov69-Cylindrotheca_fusiformis.AAC.3
MRNHIKSGGTSHHLDSEMESRRLDTDRAMVGDNAFAQLRQTIPMDPSLDIASTMSTQRLLTLITMALEVTGYEPTGGERSDAPNETEGFDGRHAE